jgi:uncharacterized membrane protein YczE
VTLCLRDAIFPAFCLFDKSLFFKIQKAANFFIAAAIEFGVLFFPIPHNYLIGIIYCVVGIALVGMGSTFYITCGLGPGPRDGLMTALHNKTGVRVGRIRLAIEATVLVLGALLGGRIGLGTALFALFIGQSIAISLGVVSRITAR